jgi:MFS family permease
MGDWGWRIPFALGACLLPFLFAIRRLLEETPVFARQTSTPAMRTVIATVMANWLPVLLGMLMATMTTVFFYMITAYTPTYGNSVLKLSPSASMAVTLCVGVTNFVLLPVMGAVSDRIGRLPLLVACAGLGLVSGYPALHWLAEAPSFGRLLAVELWFATIYAAYNAAMVVFLTEVMPARVRASGFALAYSLATAIFGGFTPAIATFLIDRTHDKAVPGLWLTAAALCGLVASVGLAHRARRRADHAEGFADPILAE